MVTPFNIFHDYNDAGLHTLIILGLYETVEIIIGEKLTMARQVDIFGSFIKVYGHDNKYYELYL